MSKTILTVLTGSSNKVILIMPLTHSAVGIETLITTGQKAAIFSAVFLCPSIFKTESIRFYFVMVGYGGQSKGWLVPVAGSLNPAYPATQRLRPKGGGLKLITGATAMNNHAQNPHTYSVSYYEAEKIKQHNKIIPLSSKFFLDKPTNQNLQTLKADLLAFMQTIQQMQIDQAIKEPVKRSVFNVFNLYGEAIIKSLTYSEALSLRKDLKGKCLIKFAGMEVVK